MSSTVLIAARSGNDGYGKPTYGSDVSYTAHLGHERKLVRTPGGQEVESGQQIHLSGSPAVQPTARITLSTADVGSTEAFAINPTIISVDRRFDGIGAHHTVIFV